MNHHFSKILIVGVLLLFGYLMPAPAHADTASDQQRIQELQAKINALEQQASAYRSNIAGEQAKANSLKKEISILQNQIGGIQAQIAATDAKIGKTEIEIGGIQEKIGDTREEMSRKRETVGRMIYFLDQKDKESILTSLLKYANLSAFLSQLHDLASMQGSLLNIVTGLKEVKASLEDDKVELEAKQADLEQLSDEAAQRKRELDAVKNQKNSVLKVTKGQEANYQKLLTDTEKLQRDANLEVFRLEEQLRQALDPNSVPSIRPGILSWPLAISGRVTQGYGCIESAFARRNYPTCNGGRGGFHNGYDIAAPYGTPLLAADDGRVIAVGSAPNAYGTWLVIEHPNGLATAYTHMSVRKLAVGQVVKRGTVVGEMGSTGLSTGSHLHFMVYAPKTFTVQASKISGTLPIGATLNPPDYLP